MTTERRPSPRGPRRGGPPKRVRFQRPGPMARGPRRADAEPYRPTAREMAFETLCRLDEERVRRVTDFEQDWATDQALDARGRRFYHELVYGTLRRRLTLDCVIASYLRDPISRIDPDCLVVLRLGTYQLLFLDGVPPFAAISESVDLLRRRHAGVGAMVNAVLRTIARETKRVDVEEDNGGASPRKRLLLSERKVAFFTRSVFADPAENLALHLAQVHSHPPFLVERWLERHDRAVVEAMLRAGNEKPVLAARVNRLRTDRDGLLRRLVSEGLAARAGNLPESVRIEAPPTEAVGTRAFAEGLFYLQDEAAMKVAPALKPRPDERILDLCAAPGGKATHLAELTADRAVIVAVDRDPRRLQSVAENVARLGLKSVTCVPFDPLGDEPPPEPLCVPFDAVLVDAPCSNTGVLGRRPEVRWRVSVDAIHTLAERGRALLHRAVRLVKPGGRIVFSTCSLEPEENADAVARVLVGEPGLRLERQEETLPAPGGQDGGYFAVLERAAE